MLVEAVTPAAGEQPRRLEIRRGRPGVVAIDGRSGPRNAGRYAAVVGAAHEGRAAQRKQTGGLGAVGIQGGRLLEATIMWSGSPAWLEATVARGEAHAPGHRVGADEDQARSPVTRRGEGSLRARGPVLGVAHVHQRPRPLDLGGIAVDRLARRVGDRVAVALEEAHHRDLPDEELPCAGLRFIGTVVGDLDALSRAGRRRRPCLRPDTGCRRPTRCRPHRWPWGSRRAAGSPWWSAATNRQSLRAPSEASSLTM